MLWGSVSAAFAANCSSYPYTTLANATTADATVVMANFMAIQNCANSALAPIASPTFTGAIGLGGAPTAQLFLTGTYATTGAQLIDVATTLNSSATSLVGADFASKLNSTGASVSSITGVFSRPTISTGSNNTAFWGVASQLKTGASYTGQIGNAINFFGATPSFTGTHPAANMYGFFQDTITNGNGITSGAVINYGLRVTSSTASPAAGGTLRNVAGEFDVGTGSGGGDTINYGVFIDGAGGSGGAGSTLNFSLWDNSTAPSYFAGNVGIGTTSYGGWNSSAMFAVQTSNAWSVSAFNAGTTGGSMLVRVDDPAVYLSLFYYGGTNVGSITTNGSNTAYNTTSDERLKTTLPIQRDYRAAIRKLWVGDFAWKSSHVLDFGIKAQQAYLLFPAAIRKPTKPSEFWEADYGKLAPLALWGVKDLYAENDIQKREIVDLRKKLADQGAKLDKLEGRLASLERHSGIRTAQN